MQWQGWVSLSKCGCGDSVWSFVARLRQDHVLSWWKRCPGRRDKDNAIQQQVTTAQFREDSDEAELFDGQQFAKWWQVWNERLSTSCSDIQGPLALMIPLHVMSLDGARCRYSCSLRVVWILLVRSLACSLLFFAFVKLPSWCGSLLSSSLNSLRLPYLFFPLTSFVLCSTYCTLLRNLLGHHKMSALDTHTDSYPSRILLFEIVRSCLQHLDVQGFKFHVHVCEKKRNSHTWIPKPASFCCFLQFPAELHPCWSVAVWRWRASTRFCLQPSMWQLLGCGRVEACLIVPSALLCSCFSTPELQHLQVWSGPVNKCSRSPTSHQGHKSTKFGLALPA